MRTFDKKNTIVQFIKFGIVGVSNTLISFFIYYVLLYFKVNYLVASTAGFIVSVLNAYFWNNKYVFSKNEDGHMKTLIKTYISYGGTYLLNMALLFIMVHFLSISKIIAPVLILLITIPLNFILNKFWTFK